ncbi:MAG: ribose-phosphate pyrophosphokinase [Lachnospiraceae bacterium]|nr:ribose-phosphate pyrophosphokinase [Lachnospiraceae bacterium]
MKPSTTDTQVAPVLRSAPEGRLTILPLASSRAIGEKVNDYLVEWRTDRVVRGAVPNNNGYARTDYIIDTNVPRFGSGEAKGVIAHTVRGDDIYIMVDVMNYSLTYNLNQYVNVASPDDHYADLKRIIAAIGNRGRRVNVIMPYLYEGRQQLSDGHDSLDCAQMLQELERLGVNTLVTFDAHEPRVENAIPMAGFQNIRPTYQFIKSILREYPDLQVDADHLMSISPDEGGMNRAVYLANVLGVDMGMFYDRLDYSVKDDNGRHPLVSVEFLGSKVAGKDCIIIDDLISSGDKIVSTSRRLKAMGAKRIIVCATFGIFTNGWEQMDKAYEEGLIDRLFTTNLIYQPEELLAKPYYTSVDMSKFIALIIDTLNHDSAISHLLNPVDRIHAVVEKHRRGETI